MVFLLGKEGFSGTSPHQWFARPACISGEDIFAVITDVFDWLERVWHLPVAEREHRRVDLPLPFITLHEEAYTLADLRSLCGGALALCRRVGSMIWFLLALLPLQEEGEKERFIAKRIWPLSCGNGNGNDYIEP
jgi:hypothetical protein